MKNDKINILIVGSEECSKKLKQKLCQNDKVEKIYITDKDMDLRENDETGLLKFVIKNNIDLTIPISNTALNSDIVSFFNANGQNVFGPSKKSCQIALNKIQGKKLLYKIHAQTSKFGIFDKVQQAIEYLKTANFPIVITTKDGKDKIICPTMSLASKFLNETINFHSETDILIEEYVYGHKFNAYFITDGYEAVPFAITGEYKYNPSEKANNAFSQGCYTPDFKISQIVISKLKNIINNTLKNLTDKESSYVGFLGLSCTLTGEDSFYVNEYKPFFENHEIDAILQTTNEDLIKLFYSCINGYFSDEYTEIQMNETFSVSTTIKNKNLVLTQNARTLKRAKLLLEEDIEEIIEH